MQQPLGYHVLRRLPATDGAQAHLVVDPRAPDHPPLVLVRAAPGSPAAVTDQRIAVLGALDGHPLGLHVQRLVDLVPADGDGDGVGLVVEHLPDRLGSADGRPTEARRDAVARIAEVVAALHRAGWTHGALGPTAIAWRGAVPVLADFERAAPATVEGVHDDRAALEAMEIVVAGERGASPHGGPRERTRRTDVGNDASDALPWVDPLHGPVARTALEIRLPGARPAIGVRRATGARSRASHRGGRPGPLMGLRRPTRPGFVWAFGCAAAVLAMVLVGVAIAQPGEAEAVAAASPGPLASAPALGPLPADPLAAVDALLAHREVCGTEPACLAETTQEGSPARMADEMGEPTSAGEGPSLLLDETGGAVVVERPGAIVIAMDTRAGRRIRAVVERSD